MKLLIADLARERANTRLLVQLDGNRLLVVAEEAREYGRQRFVLRVFIRNELAKAGGARTFFGPWGFLAAFLRLPYVESVSI